MADSGCWYAKVDKIEDKTYDGILSDRIEKELFIRGEESECREAVLHLLSTGVYDQGEITNDETNNHINWQGRWQGRPQEHAPKDWVIETMWIEHPNGELYHYREEHTNGQTVTRNVLTGKIVDSVGD